VLLLMSGPESHQSAAREALVAAGFDVDEGPFAWLPSEAGHVFVIAHGDDVETAATAVRGFGWALRAQEGCAVSLVGDSWVGGMN
jgi:hypothetical protein